MPTPDALADPRYFANGVVEYELIWGNDNTATLLDVICDGQKHRLKMTFEELDLLRKFLNANLD